jgi:hypothetical protein
MGSGFDDWVYWHFFTITVNHKSSHIELLLNSVSLMNLYEESVINLGLVSTIPRNYESTAFYNCHAARIEVTVSNSSSVLLCCHGNAFVSIRCSGNKCLPSRYLTKMTSASAIILA